MLELKSLSVQNLLSFGRVPTIVHFDDFDSLVVTAPNGAGKSALLSEALHFGLYGKPYRNCNLDDLVNRTNKKELLVKVTFKSGQDLYEVKRGIKPKIFEVWKNGSQLHENVSKKDFQSYLNDLIGIDYSIFSSLCMIDNTFYRPFMDLKLPEKREIVDKIFGLNMTTAMLVKAREYKTNLNQTIQTIDRDIIITKEKLKLANQFAKDRIAEEMERLSGEINGLVEEKDKTEALMKHHEAEYQRASDLFGNFKTNMLAPVESELARLNEESTPLIGNQRMFESEIQMVQRGRLDSEKIAEIFREITDHEHDVKTLTKQKSLIEQGKCPECGQEFHNQGETLVSIEESITKTTRMIYDKRKTIDLERSALIESKRASIVEIESKMKTLTASIVDAERRRKEMVDRGKSMQEKLNASELNIRASRTEFDRVDKTLARTRESYNKLRASGDKANAEIVAYETDLDVKQKDLARNQRMHHAMLEAEKILSDGGVRSYVLARYLPKFNETLRKYLTMMNAEFTFSFNKEFEDVVDDRYRSSFSYTSLSSGQKARVNFATTFAFMDFGEKRNDTKANFILLDEALENGLDEEGKQAILQIITKTLKKKAIVITHDSLVQEFFQKKLVIKKQGLFSKAEML